MAGLRWADVGDEGRVRPVRACAGLHQGGRTRDVFVSSPSLRRALQAYAGPLRRADARTRPPVPQRAAR
jgi:hypothetical protein